MAAKKSITLPEVNPEGYVYGDSFDGTIDDNIFKSIAEAEDCAISAVEEGYQFDTSAKVKIYALVPVRELVRDYKFREV